MLTKPNKRKTKVESHSLKNLVRQNFNSDISNVSRNYGFIYLPIWRFVCFFTFAWLTRIPSKTINLTDFTSYNFFSQGSSSLLCTVCTYANDNGVEVERNLGKKIPRNPRGCSIVQPVFSYCRAWRIIIPNTNWVCTYSRSMEYGILNLLFFCTKKGLVEILQLIIRTIHALVYM
jgi:hypothetical protein